MHLISFGYDRDVFNRRGPRVRLSRSRSRSPGRHRNRALDSGDGCFGADRPIEGRWRHDKFEELEHSAGDEEENSGDEESRTRALNDLDRSSQSTRPRKLEEHNSSTSERKPRGARTGSMARGDFSRDHNQSLVLDPDDKSTIRDNQRSLGIHEECPYSTRDKRRRPSRGRRSPSKSTSPNAQTTDTGRKTIRQKAVERLADEGTLMQMAKHSESELAHNV
ncbi:unnamed protein product [Protopolystoma xenopodis]|uniref:Btz domain-containing protein n=1 Tax=Protopolystoma xenopodis TaxID=117903 RepID=A0A3S5BP83_9PLAT|nr:unnamed protein product [Protopolystoma xenopodis]